MNQGDLTGEVIGAAIEVHKELGPGLLESAYEMALERELQLRNMVVERQKPVHLEYKGALLGDAFRIDMLINGSLLIEIKATEQTLPLHEAQLLTYLRLSGRKLGLLINFNVKMLKDGIRRVANGV